MSSAAFRETTELVRRAKGGDSAALRGLLDRYSPRLQERIRSMLGPRARRRAESSDFLQEVFVEILEGFDRFAPRDDEAFMRWAAQIARNTIRDEARRPGERAVDLHAERDPERGGTRDTPSNISMGKERAERVRAVLETMPDDLATVIRLRDFEGLSYAEVGRRMDRTENAAQLLHARALAQLGGLLSDDEG